MRPTRLHLLGIAGIFGGAVISFIDPGDLNAALVAWAGLLVFVYAQWRAGRRDEDH